MQAFCVVEKVKTAEDECEVAGQVVCSILDQLIHNLYLHLDAQPHLRLTVITCVISTNLQDSWVIVSPNLDPSTKRFVASSRYSLS